jgi:hypothetical protein
VVVKDDLALLRLGERESGTACLEQAVAAYDEALKERTRERVPLQWAMSTGSQGVAVMLLAERIGDVTIARSDRPVSNNPIITDPTTASSSNNFCGTEIDETRPGGVRTRSPGVISNTRSALSTVSDRMQARIAQRSEILSNTRLARSSNG